MLLRDRGRGAGLGPVDEAVDSTGESGDRTAPPEPVLGQLVPRSLEANQIQTFDKAVSIAPADDVAPTRSAPYRAGQHRKSQKHAADYF